MDKINVRRGGSFWYASRPAGFEDQLDMHDAGQKYEWLRHDLTWTTDSSDISIKWRSAQDASMAVAHWMYLHNNRTDTEEIDRLTTHNVELQQKLGRIAEVLYVALTKAKPRETAELNPVGSAHAAAQKIENQRAELRRLNEQVRTTGDLEKELITAKRQIECQAANVKRYQDKNSILLDQLAAAEYKLHLIRQHV